MVKKGFKPVINKDVKILILGSCPGDKSIQEQQYYAGHNNHFWKILSKIINFDLCLISYNQRLDVLLNNNIGLWDVMYSCERKGSLDSNITKSVLNDFSKLELPKLKLILFNGKKSYHYKDLIKLNVSKRLLTSSSGANTIPIQDKIIRWLDAFKIDI